MITIYLDKKTFDKKKISNDQFLYFINNLKGNWAVKITKAGNIKFCETDEKGNVLHRNIFYTLYYSWQNGFYFRRTTPSGQYQLFRTAKYKGTGKWYDVEYDWKHFKHIMIAVARFNQYYDRCTTGSMKHWQWTHNSFLAYHYPEKKPYVFGMECYKDPQPDWKKLENWRDKF